MAVEIRVDTPHGEGRLVTRRARAPRGTVLLSHGAGRGIDAPDLVALFEGLPSRGITVVLFEQPWRVAGRSVASPPASLDAGLRAAADQLRTRTPLVIGGRSAGARSACRTARELGAVGCVALAFPLHPPGKPEKSRLDELAGSGLPTLVLQGDRDAFGGPSEFPRLKQVELVAVPGADHGFAVTKRQRAEEGDPWPLLVDSVAEWTERRLR